MPIEQREMGMVNRTTTFFVVWVLAPFPKVDLFDLCRRGNAVAVQVEMRDKEFAQLLCYLRVCVDNISAFGLNPGDSSGFGVLKRLPDDFWRHVFRKKLKLKQAAAAGFGRRVRAMRGPAGRGVAHRAPAPPAFDYPGAQWYSAGLIAGLRTRL